MVGFEPPTPGLKRVRAADDRLELSATEHAITNTYARRARDRAPLTSTRFDGEPAPKPAPSPCPPSAYSRVESEIEKGDPFGANKIWGIPGRFRGDVVGP